MSNTRSTRLWQDTPYNNNYKSADLVLFPTKDSAQEFHTRFDSLNPGHNKNQSQGTFRTLYSFLITFLQHIKQGNSYRRIIIIINALMMHAGEVIFGNINQIPYVNRSRNLNVKFHKISEILKMHDTSDIQTYYPSGMKTTISVKNNIAMYSLEHLSQIVDKNKHTCIFFKQPDKLKLSKLGFKASTHHEFQEGHSYRKSPAELNQVLHSRGFL